MPIEVTPLGRASRFKKGELELLRFANKLGTDVIGGASRLLKKFIRDNSDVEEIVSYADRRWSDGSLYEKLGFSLDSTTDPSYFYIVNGHCENRMKYQKCKLVKEGFDPSLSEHDIMLSRKMYRIYDCGTLKYRISIR